MHIKHMGFLIANVCLVFGSSSIFAQANPISAIFGAAQQILPSTKSSEYKKVTQKNHQVVLKTRHSNPRTVDNHVLGQVNRTAGRLVRAVLYTPIASIQMVAKPARHIGPVKSKKYSKKINRSYEIAQQSIPTVGNPVLPKDKSFRAENYTGQDIAALGKQNNLLNLILPLFKLDAKPKYYTGNDMPRLIYTSTDEVNSKDFNKHHQKIHEKIKNIKHHPTKTHIIKTKTHNQHDLKELHEIKKTHLHPTSKTVYHPPIITPTNTDKNKALNAAGKLNNLQDDKPLNSTITPTGFNNSETLKPNKSPTNLEKMVPVNSIPTASAAPQETSFPLNDNQNVSQPVSDVFTMLPLAVNPYLLNEPGPTIPNAPVGQKPPIQKTGIDNQTNLMKNNNAGMNSDIKSLKPNNGFNAVPASQNIEQGAPIKDYEICPKKDKNS